MKIVGSGLGTGTFLCVILKRSLSSDLLLLIETTSLFTRGTYSGCIMCHLPHSLIKIQYLFIYLCCGGGHAYNHGVYMEVKDNLKELVLSYHMGHHMGQV